MTWHGSAICDFLLVIYSDQMSSLHHLRLLPPKYKTWHFPYPTRHLHTILRSRSASARR